MSLSQFIYATLQDTYQALPVFAVGPAASAALSLAVNRYTSFTLSNPMDAAKFTVAAIIGVMADRCCFSDESGFLERRKYSLQTIASRFTCIGLMAYAAHSIANPEKTLASFALLSIQAAASVLLATTVVKQSESESYGGFEYGQFELDKVGLKMVKSIYQNIHRTVAAAGSAWLTARTFNTLGFDPKATMIFTAAASAIYYATKPLFHVLESGGDKNIFSRALCLLSLAKVSADMLKLDLPLYKEFAKVCGVVSLFIAVFDKADRFIPNLGFGESELSSENEILRYRSNFGDSELSPLENMEIRSESNLKRSEKGVEKAYWEQEYRVYEKPTKKTDNRAIVKLPSLKTGWNYFKDLLKSSK